MSRAADWNSVPYIRLESGSTRESHEPINAPESPWSVRALEFALDLFPPFVGARVITASLRALGFQIGRTARFWGIPHFEGDARRHLTVGENCGFNVRCSFELGAALVFEDHVSVGHEVSFLATEPIRVGAGSWIGARAIIHPGVTIGPGTIIGPLTEVKADVGPNLLVLGNRKVSIANWRQT